MSILPSLESNAAPFEENTNNPEYEFITGSHYEGSYNETLHVSRLEAAGQHNYLIIFLSQWTDSEHTLIPIRPSIEDFFEMAYFMVTAVLH